MNDRILICGLVVAARVGVPDLERRVPQRLEVDVMMEGDFRAVAEEVERTTDYAEVSQRVRRWCAEESFRLIESLAEDLATKILIDFLNVQAVEVTIRKFVLPEAASVEVSVYRGRRKV